MCKKGRKHECYSVIAITLRYMFASSHNASTLWRRVIAFYSYHSRLIEIVIVFYSYHSWIIGNIIDFYSYRSESMTKAITRYAITFLSNVADLCVSYITACVLK
jgi:hypothetical protein